MKKRLYLTSILITWIVFASDAQISYGIKAGLSFNSVTNLGGASSSVGTVTSSSESKMKIGWHMGGYTNIPFSELLGFQPELLFSIKGYEHVAESKVGNIESSSTTNTRLNYIEIPLQLRVNPSENFYLLAGPYFGTLVGASSTSTNYSSVPPLAPITTTSTSSSTNGLNSLDLGISIGAGVQIDNGFTGGVKYLRGFTSIASNNGGSANANTGLQIFVGFAFGNN